MTQRGFTGEELDAETGFVYFGGRYHDPRLARFLSPDPTVPRPLDPQAFNPYAYARNNPATNIDPTGFSDVPFFSPGFGFSEFTFLNLSYTTLAPLPTFLGGNGPFVLGLGFSAPFAELASPDFHHLLATVQRTLDALSLLPVPVVATPAALGSAAISLSQRDFAGAGLGVLAAIPIVGPASKIARGATILENAARGRAFENTVLEALNVVRNNTAIENALGRAIPDSLDGSIPGLLREGVTEIKDALVVSNRTQLRIEWLGAMEKGVPFNVIVSPRTQHITREVRSAVERAGGTILRFDPATRSFSHF